MGEQENEEEVELEQETEKEREAPVERRYMRDSEDPQPWLLQNLVVAGGPESVFYPIGEFTVNKGMTGKSCDPLVGLPGFVMMSENLYRRTWRFTSVRRLKNVICFLEWVPNTDQLKRLDYRSNLTAEQRASFKETFDLYDLDRRGSIGAKEVKLLFRALDLDAEGESVVANLGSRRMSWEQIEKEVSSQTFCKMQQGRFFVALSLREAEHLRAAMHLLSPDVWPSKNGLALRSLGNKEGTLNDSLLDAYGPVLKSVESNYQLEVAEQILRFANSAEDFQARDLNIVLRSLQAQDLQHRLTWWSDVRSCRRRSQQPWQQLPVAKVFVSADEFDDLPVRALLSQMRLALATRHLFPMDAFRQFNTSRGGGLNMEEFTAGLDWLGLRPRIKPERWAHLRDALFKLIDKDGNLVIDMEEFISATELDPADWEAQQAEVALTVPRKKRH